MPAPSAVLFNHETNTYEEVPGEQVGAAIASGQYTATGGSTVTQAEGGNVTRDVEELGAAGTQGEVSAGAANAERAAGARRDEQRELNSDKVLTFVEGVGDALTVGLLHGTNEKDELRREADSGSALLGQLVGTALGLKLPGPISGITKGGEALGEGVARALLGEAETGFRGVVTAGLKESAANAALMAASAFGHEITDSVLADKPFAAEAIGSEAGVGALLGFGAGFLGSSFGKLARASRGAVEASGVAVKESRAALDAVNGLTRSWDDVVEQHGQRVGVLKALADDGHIPGELHAERSAALRQAERARDALREIDPERALGGDAKEFQKWRGAVEKYQDAVMDLDSKMTPSAMERASASPIKLGKPEDLFKPSDIERLIKEPELVPGEPHGGPTEPSMSQELDREMMNPERRAEYERIYGRPWEPVSGGGQMVGEENLGGVKSATSDLGTNPGTARRRGRPAPQAPSEPESTALVGGGPDTVVDPRVERFNKQPAKYREPRDTVIEAQGKYREDLRGGQTVGREVLEAGERPVPQAETAQEFVDNAKKHALPEGSLQPEEPRGYTKQPSEGQKAVKDYLNSWFREFDSKPRVSLGDQVQVRLQEALGKLAGSRLDSAGSLALLKSLGLKEATSPLGQRLDQVWSLGQAGKFAADEARGVKTPLRKGLMDRVKQYAVGKAGKAIGGAVIGGSMGGPMGAVIGMALTSAGFAGKAASSAGKLMQSVAKVGEALLTGTNAKLAVKVVAGNRPYQYSEAGPIEDPVKRIQELHALAANPDRIRQRVMGQLGDLSVTSPEVANHLVEGTVNRVVAIAQSAPMVMVGPTGKAVMPSGTALTKFFDFENAMHDLPGTLSAIGNGTASDAQLKAFHIGFPAVHGELVRGVIGNRDALDQLNDAKLRAVEKALGVPLTRATADPSITARLQTNWSAPKPEPAPAQAFKITAPKRTDAQAMSGGDRAPGNERIAR